MPEVPEVEALARFPAERGGGHAGARVDVAAVNVLKTYDPPPQSLQGLTLTGTGRHGKFLDLDVDGLHLVIHLARAGWLQWRGEEGGGPPPPGPGAAAPPPRPPAGARVPVAE